MGYKIAIGSSDGIHVDLKFGEVEKFLIYEVSDQITLSEQRTVFQDKKEEICSASNCDSRSCGGNGKGCNGSSDIISRVDVISDCRGVVCKKIGFQAQKQLEKRAISVFDVECAIKEALHKITFYYGKIDHHQSLRK